NPKRTGLLHPIYQVTFDYQMISDLFPGASQFATQLLSLDTNTAKFPLSATCRQHHNRLEILFEYSTDLFKPTLIKQMLDHYLNLLDSFVKCFDYKISTLTLLSLAEQKKILYQWNHTKQHYPQKLS